MMQCGKCPPDRNATFIVSVDYHVVKVAVRTFALFCVSSDGWLFPERISQQRRMVEEPASNGLRLRLASA